MRIRPGITIALAMTLTVWAVGDALLHALASPPSNPSLAPSPPGFWPVLASAMTLLVIVPTWVCVRRAAAGLPGRYQFFAWFAAAVRLLLRCTAGFLGGLAVEVFLRHGLTDAGHITRTAVVAAAWHGSTVATFLAWRSMGALRRRNEDES